QHDAAHHLDVEHALVRLADTSLAHGCVGLEEDAFELLAVGEPLAELDCLLLELVVRERLKLGLERADVGRLLGEPLHPPPLAEAQEFFETVSASHYSQASVGGGAHDVYSGHLRPEIGQAVLWCSAWRRGSTRRFSL